MGGDPMAAQFAAEFVGLAWELTWITGLAFAAVFVPVGMWINELRAK